MIISNLKSLSAIQRQALCARYPKITPDIFYQTVKEQRELHVNARNCQPLTLSLMEGEQVGIKVQMQLPFESLSTKRLSEKQFVQLVENGIVEHAFDPNQRPLAFTFSYKFLSGWGSNSILAVDAIDLQKKDTIGTFGLLLSLETGLTEDHRIIGLPLTMAAECFLINNNYNPGLLYKRREELTYEKASLYGSRWVNLKVEQAYRNKGKEGFYGIGQILMTTALRLAAEQFFSVAYLLGTGQWQTYYFSRVLGAQRSVKCPEYAFQKMMIVSFSGQPGFDHADGLLEQRRQSTMYDCD